MQVNVDLDRWVICYWSDCYFGDILKSSPSFQAIAIALGSAAALGTLTLIYLNTRKKRELGNDDDDLESGDVRKEVHKLRYD